MDGREIAPDVRAAQLAAILARLEAGESLNTICAADGMPTRRTVQRWCREDLNLADEIMDAREAGYFDRAERAVQAVKDCADPIKARVVFDAERWYLGKLSIAFAERAPSVGSQTNVQVNIDGGDPFGRIADLMDRAAASIAGGAQRTALVAGDGEAGPGST